MKRKLSRKSRSRSRSRSGTRRVKKTKRRHSTKRLHKTLRRSRKKKKSRKTKKMSGGVGDLTAAQKVLYDFMFKLISRKDPQRPNFLSLYGKLEIQYDWEKAFIALKQLLKDGEITELSLSNYFILETSPEIIEEILVANSKLEILYIDSCSINNKGADAIARGLVKNTKLTTLNLSNNKIGDAGAIALAEALKTNTTLTTLILDNNPISEEIKTNIQKILKINKSNLAKKANIMEI